MGEWLGIKVNYIQKNVFKTNDENIRINKIKEIILKNIKCQ